MDRQVWLPSRNALVIELLRDWAEKDPERFHRFLWTNHLGYARYYESRNAFGSDLLPSRKRLLEVLTSYFEERGIDPSRSVESVIDVGSSAGYLLRHLETKVFTGAQELLGMDIDGAAIREGTAYLARQGSRIRLVQADLSQLEKVAGGRVWDLLFCTGVLLYLTEAEAARSLAGMQKCARLVVLLDVAYPEKDNGELAHSVKRGEDETWIHNTEKMIESNGGDIVYRSRIEDGLPDGRKIHVVFFRGKDQSAIEVELNREKLH